MQHSLCVCLCVPALAIAWGAFLHCGFYMGNMKSRTKLRATNTTAWRSRSEQTAGGGASSLSWRESHQHRWHRWRSWERSFQTRQVHLDLVSVPLLQLWARHASYVISVAFPPHSPPPPTTQKEVWRNNSYRCCITSPPQYMLTSGTAPVHMKCSNSSDWLVF